MEYPIIKHQNGVVPQEVPVATVDNSKFIEANTTIVGLDEIRNKHIIPVFTKDNAPLISQADFITTARELVEQVSGYD